MLARLCHARPSTLAQIYRGPRSRPARLCPGIRRQSRRPPPADPPPLCVRAFCCSRICSAHPPRRTLDVICFLQPWWSPFKFRYRNYPRASDLEQIARRMSILLFQKDVKLSGRLRARRLASIRRVPDVSTTRQFRDVPRQSRNDSDKGSHERSAAEFAETDFVQKALRLLLCHATKKSPFEQTTDSVDTTRARRTTFANQAAADAARTSPARASRHRASI